MNLKQLLKEFPPIRAALLARYRRFFLTADRSNLFFGVFPDYAAALAATPTGKPTGYDTEAAATLYAERHTQVYPADYPVLFWLADSLPGWSRVFEIGGHTGVSFYAYKRYIEYPKKLSWTILDVPAVVDAGKSIAGKRGETRLSFLTEPKRETYDVLLAAGALQYLPDPLSQTLDSLAELPKQILLNLLPVTEQATYFTVQNMGPAFCPYKIVNRGELIADLEALGYELLDEWKNPEKSCSIPFSDAKYSLDHYCGFRFCREG
ncbi:MAG: TIGR04325 family methyltransferase [Pseudomonadota bacterium]